MGLPAVIAFGSNLPLATVLGLTIDLTGLTDLTFMVPRNGTITAMSVFFSLTAGLSLVGSSINVHAQLYSAQPADNILTAVAGSQVTLVPSFTGTVIVGDSATITQPVNIPVTAGTRLALVMFIDVSGLALVTSAIGTVSAGISIS